MDRDRILNRAKIELMDRTNKTASPVFYSSIIFALKFSWAEDQQIPVNTAAVDGKSMYINYQWFSKLNQKERVGLLAHEALHIAFRHLDSFEQYNINEFDKNIEHMLWNMAGDYIINLALIQGNYTIPQGGLLDDRFKDMSTVRAYRIIHDEYKKNTNKPQPTLGDGDLIIPTGDKSSAKAQRELRDLEVHITNVITKAAITSKMAGENPGSIPAGILRDLEIALNPPLPFEVILANYMNSYARDDYSFRRPNRRFMPEVLMPGAFSENLDNIACIFDVSGSVSREELSSFRNGIRMIMEQLKPEKLTLVEFDTGINNVREITSDTDLENIKFKGGGGTLIKPVLAWIKKNRPIVTLIFTDGDFDMPKIDLNTDIIWIINNNKRFICPYGKILHYKI